jgi:hypothetical protein
MYVVIDLATGLITERVSTASLAQQRAEALTEANEWVFGHTFDWMIATPKATA